MLKTTWSFMATTVIAIIVAVCLWQQLRSDRQAMAGLRDRVAQLELAQTRMPAAVGQQAESGKIVEQPAPPAEAQDKLTAISKVDQSVGASEFRKLREEERKDPAFREARLAQFRSQLPQQYPDLGKALGLTYEQVGALLDLLASQQMNPTPGAGDPEKAIEAQLGPDKYQQFREFRKTQISRLQVENLRTTLSSTAHPLTDYQKDLLMEGMVVEQKLRAEEGRSRGPVTGKAASLAAIEAGLRSTEEGNRRVLEEAKGYLSPEQVAALRSVMDQQLSLTRASLRVQSARLQNGAN